MSRLVTFTLRDVPDEPLRILVTMPDGREGQMTVTGPVPRDEARVILGGVMNAMRAGLRADQFRHGQVLREEPRGR